MTRSEIPIDSRVVKWINNQKFTLAIQIKKLGNAKYYETVLDNIRALCAEAGCLPCELDAAIFWEKTAKRSEEEITRLTQQGQFLLKTFHDKRGTEEADLWRGKIAGFSNAIEIIYGHEAAQEMLDRLHETANLDIPDLDLSLPSPLNAKTEKRS